MTDLGELIKEKFNQSGFSIRGLAKKVNTTTTSIYDWQTTGSIKPQNLYDLCIALNFNFFEYLSRKVEQKIGKNDTEVSIIEFDKEKTLLHDKINIQRELIESLQKRQADLEERIGELKKRLGD
jgi:ribosome-binding protein aMBF1 (putative translation factor)